MLMLIILLYIYKLKIILFNFMDKIYVVILRDNQKFNVIPAH